MTTDQEKIITLLFLKYGDVKKVLLRYCKLSHELNKEEFAAVEAWIQTDAGKPYRFGVSEAISYYGSRL